MNGKPPKPPRGRKRSRKRRPHGYAPKRSVAQLLLAMLTRDRRMRDALRNEWRLGGDMEPLVKSALVRALQRNHFAKHQLTDHYRAGPYLCANRQLPGVSKLRPDLIGSSSGSGRLPLAYQLKVLCRYAAGRRGGTGAAGGAMKLLDDVEKLEELIGNRSLDSGVAIAVAVGWAEGDLQRLCRMARGGHRLSIERGMLEADLPLAVIAIQVRKDGRPMLKSKPNRGA